MQRLGDECRRNVSLWERYMQHCMAHAQGKAVNLSRLARQVAWLEQFKPEGADIPANLTLIWLTVRLASANHHGATQADWEKTLTHLADALYLEDAPLVCNADLHQAVQYTNRFEFTRASAALRRWEHCDPAIPGLRFWAQAQSSLGQHAAFCGRNKTAVDYFDKAIDAFKLLSNGGMGEIAQTGTYRVIAMMDTPEYTHDRVTRELESLFATIYPGRDMVEAVADSSDPSQKYFHHLLLRFLVFLGHDDMEKKYLSRQTDWLTEQGHSWPLIQAYRAFLLKKQQKHDKALEFMLDGASLAFSAEQGPTVRLIGACLRAVSHAWGDDWAEGKEVLHELDAALPATRDRLQIIAHFLDTPFDGLNLLKKILPFNFR